MDSRDYLRKCERLDVFILPDDEHTKVMAHNWKAYTNIEVIRRAGVYAIARKHGVSKDAAWQKMISAPFDELPKVIHSRDGKGLMTPEIEGWPVPGNQGDGNE